MSHLVPCPGCQRHVRHVEAACPFCGVALALEATPAPIMPRARLGRAATFAFGATLAGATALVGCSGEDVGKEGGGGMSSGGSAGASNAGQSSGGTGIAPVYGAPAAGMGGINNTFGGGAAYGAPPNGFGGTGPVYGAPAAGTNQGGAAGQGGSAGNANAGSGGTLGPAPAYGVPPVPEE